MRITKSILWFIANSVWNVFVAFLLMALIDYAAMPHEAAQIGLAYDDSWMLPAFTIAWAACWAISCTVGWVAVLTSPFFFFSILMTTWG